MHRREAWIFLGVRRLKLIKGGGTPLTRLGSYTRWGIGGNLAIRGNFGNLRAMTPTIRSL